MGKKLFSLVRSEENNCNAIIRSSQGFFYFFCHIEAIFSIIKTAIDTIFIFASIRSTASCHLDCF